MLLGNNEIMEKSLLLEIQRLAEKMEDSSDGIYVVDTERKILYWNKSAERITGYTKEEMIGVHCFNEKLSHHDMNGNSLCRGLCPLVKTIFDEQVRVHEVTFLHKDGSRRPCTVETHPIKSGAIVIGAYEIFKIVE
ncbi:MAG: PAS domain S-box protein [Acholeplasmatales bacterium]|nr:PAS domain S-box protein [Acholeplasmatales bacterium]